MSTSSLPRIAICYWAVQRSAKYVIDSQKKYVFDILHQNNIEYDVYIHTWAVNQNRVWWDIMPEPINPEDGKLFKPKHMIIDNQDDFWNTVNFSDYYYSHQANCGEWFPDLLQNHICALESLKRVATLAITKSKDMHYDYVMFIRPDAYVTSPLPIIDLLKIQTKSIAIVNEEHFDGYNDKFAFMRFDDIIPYSHRIDYAAQYRKTVGTIISEKYCKHAIEHYYDTSIQVPFHFKLVRSDGIIR